MPRWSLNAVPLLLVLLSSAPARGQQTLNLPPQLGPAAADSSPARKFAEATTPAPTPDESLPPDALLPGAPGILPPGTLPADTLTPGLPAPGMLPPLSTLEDPALATGLDPLQPSSQCEHCGKSHGRLADWLWEGEGKHGHPLARESWLYRPFNMSWFAGGLMADDPLEGSVEAGTGFFTGFRLGWDYARRAGFESRFGFSKTALDYPLDPLRLGDEKLFFWDINWLWYPWGDARWRPYFTLGVGLADVDFIDDSDARIHDTLFGMPFGAGVKYRLNSRLAFRFELLDNVAFGGSRLDQMHSVSLSAGLAWHFGGGPRKNYWPWNPTRNWF